MPLSGLVFEKTEKTFSRKIHMVFEKTRAAYLSAREDPKEYGSMWEDSINYLRDQYDDLDNLSRTLKKYLEEDQLNSKEALDPTSNIARNIYEAIKEMRYNAEESNDPFSETFGKDVLEQLLDNDDIMLYFYHYALRTSTEPLSDEFYAILDAKPDTITEGVKGLDLEVDDIPLYIVEHYGDDKDSKRVESKFKTARNRMRQGYLKQFSEKEHKVLEDVDLTDVKKSVEEKSESEFLTPNKPMYRIFEIGDMEELKGFSGDYLVQEKYDGMRIQIHKNGDSVKIYSHNAKDITDKCKKQVELMKRKSVPDCILDAELILFDKKEPLHRADTIAHVFKNKYPDHYLSAHVFDVMKHEDRDLTKEPLKERINILFYQYAPLSDERLAYPSKKDSRIADSIKEVENYSKEIMELPASEGVVIKDLESTYFVGTKKNPKWIKWKKFTDLDLMVLDVKSTKSGMYSYTLGAGPLSAEESRNLKGKEIDDRTYLPVGKALNTKQKVEVGSIVRVKVDEVKRKGEGYSLFSAKVIEIPEVEYPDKLVTLEMLAKDGKKSLKYKVDALKKSFTITDNIHGTATIIAKSDFDGFVVYGFEENNLMAKNALSNLDVWKTEMENMMKSKRSELRVSIRNKIIESGEPFTIKQIEKFVIENHAGVYDELFDNDLGKLVMWMKQQNDLIYEGKDKFNAAPDVLEKDIEIKKNVETNDTFKLYLRDDKNIDVKFNIKGENMIWFVDTEDSEDVFNYLGKSAKYKAEVSRNFQGGKLIDEGKLELGVQRHGYHEYILKGNKLDTKLHFRVVEVDGEKHWITFTGFTKKPVKKDTDEEIWNIYEDRFKKLTIEREESD